LPSTPIPKESVKFALVKDNNNRPRRTAAKKFCALLYHYMQWSVESRYRIMALYQKLEGQELLVFNLDEAVEVQSTTIITDDGKKKIMRDIYLPIMFKENFGFNYNELEERRKVDLNDMFLFIDPKTAQTQLRTIEPKIHDAEDIIKSNYRPNSEKIYDSKNSGGGNE
jgi:hypothetical protein